MSHWAIQMVVSQCGLPAGSNQLKPACVDQDDQVNSDSQGVLQNCSAATAFPLGSGGTVNLCEDDSVAIALGAPAGWVHALCPVTCGIPCLSTPLQCVPALDTCDGAVGWFIAKEQACPTEPVEKDGHQYQAHTLASCGNSTACKDFIGSIDDKAAAMVKTGFASCAGVPGKESYATYQEHAEYAFLLRLALLHLLSVGRFLGRRLSLAPRELLVRRSVGRVFRFLLLDLLLLGWLGLELCWFYYPIRSYLQWLPAKYNTMQIIWFS